MKAFPLEDHETARWKKYQKDITELVAEFEAWSKALMAKHNGELTEKEKEEFMFRVSDDGKFIIALDIEKLLGKK